MQKNGCELGLFILLVLIACAVLSACGEIYCGQRPFSQIEQKQSWTKEK